MYIAMELALKPTKGSALVEILAFLVLIVGAISKVPVVNWICRVILGALVVGFFVFMAKQESTQTTNAQPLLNWRLFAALGAAAIGSWLGLRGIRRQENGQKIGVLGGIGVVLVLVAIGLLVKW